MKKYLFGILALVLAIGFSAFTVKKNNNNFQETFFFKGDPSTPGAFEVQSNWSKVSGNLLVECGEEMDLTCSFEVLDSEDPSDGNLLDEAYDVVLDDGLVVAVERDEENKKTNEDTFGTEAD